MKPISRAFEPAHRGFSQASSPANLFYCRSSRSLVVQPQTPPPRCRHIGKQFLRPVGEPPSPSLRQCEHHPHTLQSTDRSERAAAVLSRYLVPALCNQAHLVRLNCLHLKNPLGANDLLAWRNYLQGNELVDIEALQALDLLFCCFTPEMSIRHPHRLLKNSRDIRLRCLHGVCIFHE